MKKLIQFILLISAISIVGISCKKKSDDPAPAAPPAKTQGDIVKDSVSSKPYVFESAKVGDLDVASIYFTDKECQRDDYLKFNKDGSYVVTDQGAKCSPANNQTGTWSISDDGKTISTTLSGTKSDLKDVMITSDGLKGKVDYSYNGTVYVIDVTLKKVK